jgi:polyisoprenoid-binding protein YceI
VDAPVSTLVTGNGHRDKDLNKSMESDLYPTIRFNLTGVTPGAERGDTVDVVLQGRFTIHGVTREASIPATVVNKPDARGCAGIRRSASRTTRSRDSRS